MFKLKALIISAMLSLFVYEAFAESEMETFQNRLNLVDKGQELQKILEELLAKKFRSQEITAIGKRLEDIILKWADKGEKGRSIFISDFGHFDNQKVDNVWSGDVYMPSATVYRMRLGEDNKPLLDSNKKPVMEEVTGNRLLWTEDLKAVQFFLQRFAPKSDSLKKAWQEIISADHMMQIMLTEAHKQEQNKIEHKVIMFSTFIPTLEAMRQSLVAEQKKVNGVWMWFYDTKASKALMLTTIPVVIVALDRMIDDYSKLKSESKGAEKAIAEEERTKLLGKSAASAEAAQEVYENRTSGALDYSLVKRQDPSKKPRGWTYGILPGDKKPKP